MTMTTLVVSAFEDRRPECFDSMVGVGGLERTALHIIESPLGRDVLPDTLRPHPHWRDSHNPKLLTYGELGCMAGHIAAWNRVVAEDEPCLIVEDDARAVGPIPSEVVAARLADAVPRLVYLGYKVRDEWPDEGDGTFRSAPLCWWTIGYALNPAAARVLLGNQRTILGNQAIPADELVPLSCGNGVTENRLGLIAELGPGRPVIEAACFVQPCIQPASADSTTDNRDYAFSLKTIVFATDATKARVAMRSLESQGHDVTVLGEGKDGWDTAGEGGRQKLEWLASWCADNRHQPWIVLAMDGYDTLMRCDPSEMLTRYGQMRHPLIVSGETRHWPPRQYPDSEDGEVGASLKEGFDKLPPYDGEDEPRYPYPCSGLVMGDIRTLYQQLADRLASMPNESDDQAIVQFDVLDNPRLWRIDREAYLFQSLGGDDNAIDRDGRNRHTGTWPAVLHANGPDATFPEAWAPERVPIEDAPIEVAYGIMQARVFSVEDAHRLAAVLDAQPGWQSLRGDNVPGDELRLDTVHGALAAAGFGDCEELIEGVLAPVMEARWYPPVGWKGIKDLFAIRYAPFTQDRLRLHTDLSRFSASIVLRRAGAGGELHLPRQNFTDRLTEPGMALAWPSQVTHPHAVTPVTAGQRISLVVWTHG